MPMKLTSRTVTSFVGAMLLAALLVVPSFLAFSQMKGAAKSRQLTYGVILHAEALQSALISAETGQRGFLLTGDETFLEPYTAVHDQVRGQLGALRQLTMNGAALKHLDAVAPLLDAKLAEMSYVIWLRRNHDTAAVQALVASGKGKQLMDAIRVEMAGFIQVEEGTLARNDTAFQSRMNRLFAIIVVVSLFTLLVALAFVRAIRRQTQQRLKDLVHLETGHLLEVQEATNVQLQKANCTLQESEEKLTVTLNSIGDAVISTDAEARIKLMNPVAEQLTGWPQAEAVGHQVDEVFQIINQETRRPAATPIMAALKHGTIQGLANHTLLIARDGTECAIADSCAPIRDAEGLVIGAVLVFRDVTEEYAAQQALRDSNAMLQTILGTMVDGIITIQADNGVVERVNPAAERMFGYAASQLIGQNFDKLIPELAQAQGHGTLNLFRTSEEARAIGLGREVEGRRQDGRLFPLEMAISEMYLGGKRYFTGVLRDISTRKQTEAALAKSGALQHAIFASANFSSIATDAKGVIQIFNVGAEEMLGYSAAEVMNKNTPADFSDPKEVIDRAEALSLELETAIAPGFEALAFKAYRGIEDIYELTLIRKGGTRFPAVVSVTALRNQPGAVIGYLLIATDNSARKRVEAERELLDQALKDKNTELEMAISVADKANLAKSEFLSSMSHELRSPLNAILGFAQLMDSAFPPATPSQKASIDRILHAGWYLLELINQILDLAVIESGNISLSEEPVALAEVMFDCQSIFEPQGLKRGIRLTFPTFPTPTFVFADRVRLKQVLINLLSNAIKYNRPGGSVVVACTPSGEGRVRISVTDTGQGLAPEKVRQLFQPFNRLGQEHGIEEGTGIGLVMSKLLVELMGGALGVESTVGVGSVFWYDLNGAESPALVDAKVDSRVEPHAVDRAGAALRTVLCVEDNPANLDLIAQLIARRPNLRLLSAQDAALGLELARENQPDVILMDINLPGMSGLQALKILKMTTATEHIPVVAISANAMVGDIKLGLDAGFFRYLTKPIKVQAFMAALDEALDHAELNPAPIE